MGNEEELCEALVAFLESEVGSERGNVTYPEDDGSGPPVEMRLDIGEWAIAIEHTLIEPFPKSIQTGQEFFELTAEIVERLNGRMPEPGTYILHFPIHPTEGRHRRTHAQLRERIITWITQAGQELHEECPLRKDRHHAPHGYQGKREANVDGLPLTLSLRVHWSEGGGHDGALFLSRSVGPDIEDQRLVRMHTALDKKLPKLSECARLGDTTFLILEWSDIALSNHIVIGRALEAALAGRNDWPDHVLLAATANEQWHFFRPVIDGTFSIDMEYIEIHRTGIERSG